MKMTDSSEPVSKRLRTHARLASIPSTSNPMLSLTDVCLQKVFVLLDVENLFQMANVCKRFRSITEHVFSEQHKDFVFKGQSCKNTVFRRVLCKFGHLIKSINASDAYFSGDEKLDVNAIAKYCNIDKLESLILRETIIDCDQFKPLFSRLKQLDLTMCDFIGNKNDLFTNCPNLEVFGFEANFGDSDPLDHNSINFVVKKFPKLECLAFDSSFFAFDAFFRLLALNPQVKQLEIAAPPEDIYIQAVVEHTKNLETLAIRPSYWSNTPEIQTRKEFLQLSKLKKLQKLFLSASDEIYAKLVAPLMDAFAKDKVPINCLNLQEFSIGSKEMKSIFKLKTMQILSLDEVGNVTDADLVPMTKELPLLENVQLYFGMKAKTPITVGGLIEMVKDGKQLDYLALVGIKNLKIDKKAFDGLLKATQIRGNEKTLTIEIIGNKKSTGFDVPEETQQANNKQLKIKYEVQ